jgi:hypothetical protein
MKVTIARILKEHVIATILIFVLCLLTATVFHLYRRIVDSEGEANSSCEQWPLPSVIGPSGWAISGHITGCSPPAASVVNYVYVHPQGQKENIELLVFRYEDSYKCDEISYKWIDARTVSISLRSVGKITRLRKSVGPIQILYNMGVEGYPRYE